MPLTRPQQREIDRDKMHNVQEAPEKERNDPPRVFKIMLKSPPAVEENGGKPGGDKHHRRQDP